MLSVWFCCVFFSFLLLQKKNSKYIFFEFGFYTFFLPVGYSSRSCSEMKRIACVFLLIRFHPFSFGQKPINAIFTKARI